MMGPDKELAALCLKMLGLNTKIFMYLSMSPATS